jgi:hypothetical protein
MNIQNWEIDIIETLKQDTNSFDFYVGNFILAIEKLWQNFEVAQQESNRNTDDDASKRIKVKKALQSLLFLVFELQKWKKQHTISWEDRRDIDALTWYKESLELFQQDFNKRLCFELETYMRTYLEVHNNTIHFLDITSIESWRSPQSKAKKAVKDSKPKQVHIWFFRGQGFFVYPNGHIQEIERWNPAKKETRWCSVPGGNFLYVWFSGIFDLLKQNKDLLWERKTDLKRDLYDRNFSKAKWTCHIVADVLISIINVNQKMIDTGYQGRRIIKQGEKDDLKRINEGLKDTLWHWEIKVNLSEILCQGKQRVAITLLC